MNTDNLLMQYQSEALEALKSMTNLGKPFEKVIMDVLKLFMAIPDKINFLQMGRYGQFSEQTYRNTFTRGNFDWFWLQSASCQEGQYGLIPGTCR